MLLRLPKYWYVLAIYLFVTLLVSIFFANNSFDWNTIVLNRVVFTALFLFICFINGRLPKKWFNVVSLLIAYSFLGLVYKETAELNTLFLPKQDSLLISCDRFIFGFQPSIEFSKYFNSKFFSELMFLGYFSYYLMPLFVICTLYNKKGLNYFGFILITSFVLYYAFFIVFPAEGPQFYLKYPESYVQAKGIFGKIIKNIQAQGEGRTAAFPSSHIGISVVVLLWLYKNQKKTMLYILPFSILLFFATVYIKAHYAIDAVAGLFSGIVVFYIVNALYYQFEKRKL